MALDRVTQLYHDGHTKHFLLSFRELDHFPDRAGGDYRGALPYGLGGLPFARPHVGQSFQDCNAGFGETSVRGDKCIFAYLKPFPALEEFLRLNHAAPHPAGPPGATAYECPPATQVRIREVADS